MAASRLNAPALVRSKSIRPAFGLIVNVSSPVLPFTCVVSLPASPSMTSLPSPWFQISVSLPVPPSMSSAPGAPVTRSSPLPPLSTSASGAPVIVSLPSSPL